MRLIDADALLEQNKELADHEIEHPKYQITLREVVEECPTIFTMSFVRCENCLHYIRHDKRCGIWNHGGVVPYGFCFLGERRADETD